MTAVKKILSCVITFAMVLYVSPIPASARDAGKTVSVTDFGAVANDGQDDTAAIQNAINAAATGDTVYLPDGIYTVMNAIILKSGITLQGESQSGTILQVPANASGFDKLLIIENGVNHVDVSDLTIDGNNTACLDIAIDVLYADQVSIHNVTIKDLKYYDGQYGPFGVFVRGYGGQYDHGSSNVLISDCTFRNIGVGYRQGTAIRVSWGSHHVQVLNNWIEGVGRGGILCNDRATDLIIRNNTIRDMGIGSDDAALGIEVWGECDRSIIEDNVMDHWLSLDSSSFVAVRRNTIGSEDGSYQWCALENAGGSNNNIFTDNTIDGGHQIGISISNNGLKDYMYFGHNAVKNMIEWGAQIQGDSGGAERMHFYQCSITDTIRDNPSSAYSGDAGQGLRINDNAKYLTFDECIIADNQRMGLQIQGSNVNYLSLTNGQIVNNWGDAFQPFTGYTVFEIENMKIEGNASNEHPTPFAFAHAKPVAAMDAPLTGTVGKSLSFSDTSTAASGNIAHVLWDFDNGLPVTEANTTHTFTRAGSYRVALVVWDSAGRSSLVEQTVTISETETVNEAEISEITAANGTAEIVWEKGGQLLTKPLILRYSINGAEEQALEYDSYAFANGRATIAFDAFDKTVSDQALVLSAEYDGKKIYADAFTVNAWVRATDVTVNSSNLTIMKINDTLQLQAASVPADSFTDAPAEISWVSSNPAVASVDENGLVTAIASGMVTITVTVQTPYDSLTHTLILRVTA